MRCRDRGFTLAELLIAIAVLLLFMGVAYSALLPVLTYLSPAQAKVNTQQNAVPLLYKLQREVRQTDYTAIYVQAAGTTSVLSSLATLTDTTTFAIVSAKTGAAGSGCFPGGAFSTVPGTGSPLWRGFEVFMLQNGALKCVYEPMSTTYARVLDIPASEATTAITSATGVVNPPVFGSRVLDIKMRADATPFVVDFQIQAVSTVNGRSNATTYTEDILLRN